jgi:ERCC4-type nuclease
MSDGENMDFGPENVPKEALPDLLVDTREPVELYSAIVAACKGKIVRQETLPTDIIIPPSEKVPGWAIERKEASDFINTWYADRLGDQLIALKEFQATGEYRAALMVVGNPMAALRQRRSKTSPVAVQNMITSVESQWGIQVMPVYNSGLVATTLNYLVSKMDGKKAFVNPRSGASREKTPVEQAVYVAAGFPGIGPKMLEKIRGETSCLAHFITKSLSANMDSLTEKQITKINQMLTAVWGKDQNETR